MKVNIFLLNVRCKLTGEFHTLYENLCEYAFHVLSRVSSPESFFLPVYILYKYQFIAEDRKKKKLCIYTYTHPTERNVRNNEQ